MNPMLRYVSALGLWGVGGGGWGVKKAAFTYYVGMILLLFLEITIIKVYIYYID